MAHLPRKQPGLRHVILPRTGWLNLDNGFTYNTGYSIL